MLKAILSSFARGYGFSMGRHAARATKWLAIPLLLGVVLLGILELVGGVSVIGPLLGPFPAMLNLLGG
jgi:hypothetical protein